MKKYNWTNEEIQLLQTVYLNKTAKELKEEYNLPHSIKAICKKARELNINKHKTWSKKDVELLRYHWQNSNMEMLMKTFPNRTYSQLVNKASLLGLHSKIQRKRRGSLYFLDTLTPQSAYWWGFIMADGCLTNRNELCITISSKDLDYLRILAKHLNCEIRLNVKKNSYNSQLTEFASIRIQDKQLVSKWKEQLKYNLQKTYCPPNLELFYTKEFFVYFLIGFIDGDGCIWRSHETKTNKGSLYLKIENHSSWYDTFNIWKDKLKTFYNININVSLNNRGYAVITSTSYKDIVKLYSFVNDCDYMYRKWHHVETFVSQ